jgi:hypothetical protein
MADAEHCDCWAQERCDSRVRLHDRFPEEQDDYLGRRVEEHSHWAGRGRYYLGRHYSDHLGAAHSDFRERRDVGCCSAGPDDWVDRWADLDGSPRYWAGLDDYLADRDARRDQQDSGHHALHVAAVEPGWAERRALFSPGAALDDLRQDRR